MNQKLILKRIASAIPLIAIFSCGVPRPVSKTVQKQVVKTETHVTDKYILESPFGHKIEVEMDYTVGQTGHINNGCSVQYILTNVGTKIIDNREEFLTGAGTTIKTTRFDSTYRITDIVFEFTTSDGKKIEKSQSIFRSGSEVFLPGKSFQAETISISAGSRACVSVKPTRIEMARGLRVSNKKK